MSEENKLPDPSKLKEEILDKYPPKIARKRAKSMVINDTKLDQEIQSNVRTIPGIITQRGCTYAGCKGVVLGPTRDIINLVHLSLIHISEPTRPRRQSRMPSSA